MDLSQKRVRIVDIAESLGLSTAYHFWQVLELRQ